MKKSIRKILAMALITMICVLSSPAVFAANTKDTNAAGLTKPQAAAYLKAIDDFFAIGEVQDKLADSLSVPEHAANYELLDGLTLIDLDGNGSLELYLVADYLGWCVFGWEQGSLVSRVELGSPFAFFPAQESLLYRKDGAIAVYDSSYFSGKGNLSFNGALSSWENGKIKPVISWSIGSVRTSDESANTRTWSVTYANGTEKSGDDKDFDSIITVINSNYIPVEVAGEYDFANPVENTDPGATLAALRESAGVTLPVTSVNPASGAYYDILKAAVDKYGYYSETNDNYSGISYARRLLDFDNDGTPELLYINLPERKLLDEAQAYIVIYTYRNGKAVKLTEDTMRRDGRGLTFSSDRNGKKYICNVEGNDSLNGNYRYYTIVDGIWGKAYELGYKSIKEYGYVIDTEYTINGNKVGYDEYQAAYDAYNVTCEEISSSDFSDKVVKDVLLKLQPTTAAHELTATPAGVTVLVNGKAVDFDAYSINNQTYYQIADLAIQLADTPKRFAAKWNNELRAIELTSGEVHTGEMATKGTKTKTAVENKAKIFLDSVEISLKSYAIDGHTYYRLKDVAETFDFSVGWNGTTGTITVDTVKPYGTALSD